MKKSYQPAEIVDGKKYVPYVPEAKPAKHRPVYITGGEKKYAPYVPQKRGAKYAPYFNESPEDGATKIGPIHKPYSPIGVFVWPDRPSTSANLLDFRYHDHGDGYCGFVNETSIEIAHAPVPAGTKVTLLFSGADKNNSVKFEEPLHGKLTNIGISTSSPKGNNWQTISVTGTADRWGKTGGNRGGVDTNRFDAIMLFYYNHDITVYNVRIVLNDIEIMNRFYGAHGKTITRSSPSLPLEKDIWQGRLKACYYEDLFTSYFHNLDSDPYQDNNSRNVYFHGVDDLGQAWDPRIGKWENPNPPRGKEDENYPDLWCSEWAIWTLFRVNNSQKLRDKIGYSVENSWVRSYFKERKKWISPADVEYRKLGERIRPGYYARVKGGNHSTFFVHWIKGMVDCPCGHKGSKYLSKQLTTFNPNSSENWFLGLGGCQGSKVSLKPYRVRDAPPDDSYHIRDGINWHKRLGDGFGDTTALRIR